MFVQLHNLLFEQIFKVKKNLFLFKWNISYIFILLDSVFTNKPTIKLIEYLFLKILLLTMRSSPGPKWLLLLEGPSGSPFALQPPRPLFEARFLVVYHI